MILQSFVELSKLFAIHWIFVDVNYLCCRQIIGRFVGLSLIYAIDNSLDFLLMSTIYAVNNLLDFFVNMK